MGVNRNRVQFSDEETTIDLIEFELVDEVVQSKDEEHSNIEVKPEKAPIKIESNEVINQDAKVEPSKKVEAKKNNDNNVKFGLTYMQRNEIWTLYSNEQNEIQQKALDVNEDRFSNAYLSHIDNQTRISNFAIQKQYDIDKFTLQNIIKEGKDGKFE